MRENGIKEVPSIDLEWVMREVRNQLYSPGGALTCRNLGTNTRLLLALFWDVSLAVRRILARRSEYPLPMSLWNFDEGINVVLRVTSTLELREWLWGILSTGRPTPDRPLNLGYL